MDRSAPAHEILPGLWLGNKQASQDINWLQANQIKTVFNCTKDLTFASGIPNMYRVPVDDNLEREELRNLEYWSWEITYKMAKEREKGNRILVHCFAGMQRSAAAMAMFLISKYRCSTDEAIAFIKKKRPVAFLGKANFYPSIRGFEMGLRKHIVESGQRASWPIIPLPVDAISNT